MAFVPQGLVLCLVKTNIARVCWKVCNVKRFAKGCIQTDQSLLSASRHFIQIGKENTECVRINKKDISRYWLGNAIALGGFLPVLLLARTDNMEFEILIIEVEKDLVFGKPEPQNIGIEI